SRTVLEEELAAAKAMHAPNVDKIAAMSVEEVLADDALSSYAQRGGEVIFKENCAPCHQTGGAGVVGIYPTLVDDEWIWGGTAEAIEYTVTHGIRNANYEDARVNDMPSFDDQLSDEEIDAVADYVVAASTGASLPEGLGQEVFVDNCAACHNADYDGAEPNGNVDMGGPALNNAIWLYDGSKAGIINQIRYPRNGVMPGFGLRLSETDIKQVSVYVHTRGGGQ
ncbi:MAG: cytochrome-c oxidase, cbb3-type subunit III, partial [Rhodospirillaceae bacterium]